jgi:hypothetical protein
MEMQNVFIPQPKEIISLVWEFHETHKDNIWVKGKAFDVKASGPYSYHFALNVNLFHIYLLGFSKVFPLKC